MKLRIIGEDGRLLASGEVGEIAVRGPALMVGYWDDPRATALALAGGWLTTGDLGYLDDDGFLYISGRRKELIISGGMNVFPSEVEDVLRSHPAVHDAAVIGLPHQRWERPYARWSYAATVDRRSRATRSRPWSTSGTICRARCRARSARTNCSRTSYSPVAASRR